MDEMEVLKKAGLSESQAKVYYVLLSNGELTPAEISEKCDETRENCYSIVKKLNEMGLIEKTEAKKATYRVLNPSNLEILAERRRRIVQKNEKFLKDNMSSLLDIFYANNEMPGARTLEGIDGIKEVYRDTLRVGKDIYLLRTRSDLDLNKDGFLSSYRMKRRKMGITTHALCPDSPEGRRNMISGQDVVNHFDRVVIGDDYTAPVEIDVYGDKVAFISFSETQMATIITSPTISEAMRQILKSLMEFYKK